MAVSADSVRELRRRTGAGMMDCKRALQETGGDLEAAIEHMRVAGLARADRKADRVATEGAIFVGEGADGARAMVELNCETDFVARNEIFTAFGNQLTAHVLTAQPDSLEALLASALPGDTTVDEARRGLVVKLGENVGVRRFCVLKPSSQAAGIAAYVHGRRIGVLVELEGPAELGRDIAMHVSWARPAWVSEEQVPAEYIDREKKVLAAQAGKSGKPPEIIEKMIAGGLNKELRAVTLLGQGFVRDPARQVADVLAEASARVLSFVRYEVGEALPT